MLIITRKVGGNIIIGDDIRIKILGTRNNQIRVGIEAPKNISVHREEIYQLIQKQQTSKGNIPIKQKECCHEKE